MATDILYIDRCSLCPINNQKDCRKDFTFLEPPTSPHPTKYSESLCYLLVTCTFDTGHERISPLWPLGTKNVAFCGKEKEKWRLTACNLQHCGEMLSAKVEKGPQAIAEVELAGKPCLVMSFA